MKTILRLTFILLLSLTLSGCDALFAPPTTQNFVDSSQTAYNGKTISSIATTEGGRVIKFTFTDNTTLELSSYKYPISTPIRKQ